jgi:hypothetical protein
LILSFFAAIVLPMHGPPPRRAQWLFERLELGRDLTPQTNPVTAGAGSSIGS